MTVNLYHEMGFAKQVADRVIFMDEGEIIESNTPHEFFDNPQHAETGFVRQIDLFFEYETNNLFF